MADLSEVLQGEIYETCFLDLANMLRDHGGVSVHAVIKSGEAPIAVMAVVRGKAASAHLLKALEEAQDLDEPEDEPGKEG